MWKTDAATVMHANMPPILQTSVWVGKENKVALNVNSSGVNSRWLALPIQSIVVELTNEMNKGEDYGAQDGMPPKLNGWVTYPYQHRLPCGNKASKTIS